MGGNVLIVLLAYLLGNFSTSYLVGKLTANIDIRNFGSGNAGSTNVLRTLGIKAAALTFLGDLIKGIVAVYLGRTLGGDIVALVCGLSVVIGHNWPILLGFKGGKGIATTIGVGFMINSLAALICVIIGIIILYRYKYVSLASMVAISFLPFTLLIFNDFIYFAFGLALALLAIYRHRENIRRLLAGKESKVGERLKVK